MAIAFGLTLTAFPPSRLTAQAPVILSGRLLRVRDRDSTALAAQWVVAHAVSARRQGPVDSQRTDAAGRFRFTIARPDSGAVYIASSRYQGIGYFSEPAANGAGGGPITLVVYDTATAGPPLTIGIRHLVLTRGSAGQKRVLDIYQVQNPGQATRVGRDSAAAVWSSALPSGVVDPQPGESDVPATAIRFVSGHLEVIAPFPPGLKQVVVTYDLDPGARSLTVPVDQPTERLELLVEDSTATAGSEFSTQDPVTIESRTFRRYSADSVAAGSRHTLRWGAPSRDPRNFGWIAVVVAALALAGGAAVAARRRTAMLPRPADAEAANSLDNESPERLAAQIAALDDKFAGRESSTPAETWSTYQQRRADLKAALARRVARA